MGLFTATGLFCLLYLILSVIITKIGKKGTSELFPIPDEYKGTQVEKLFNENEEAKQSYKSFRSMTKPWKWFKTNCIMIIVIGLILYNEISYHLDTWSLIF